MPRCLTFALCGLFLSAGMFLAQAQERADDKKADNSDLEFVERLLAARKDYQRSLEQLRAHYVKHGDVERAKWAEDELIAFHRYPKHAFILDLDVPPPTLRGTVNIPEANKLYMRAMQFKGHGWGSDYVDNQRRAELLLQQLLSQYPQSNRISDAAYQLGDIYEKAPYEQYRRSARYFERCFQWNSTTHFDARLRAARIYDRYLVDRNRALEIYQEVTRHEADQNRVQEATRRMEELRNRR